MILMMALAVIAFLIAQRRHSDAVNRWAAPLCVLIVAAAVLGSTSAYPMFIWARSGGLHVEDDQEMTERGIVLAESTHADAVVATVWAGAPAYRSARMMVDLLGKSDRMIAAEPPQGDLYPGHNKWNYDYSIRRLRPDVVLQLWGSDESIHDDLEAWGYESMCMDLPKDVEARAYFRTDSSKVVWEKLHDCAS